ncbi:MAG: hypothetical protein ACP5HC_07780 [Caldisericum sp.]
MLESLFALFLMTNLTLQNVQSSIVAPPNNVNIYNIESRTESPSLTESPSIESTSLENELKEKMYHNYRKSELKDKDLKNKDLEERKND